MAVCFVKSYLELEVVPLFALEGFTPLFFSFFNLEFLDYSVSYRTCHISRSNTVNMFRVGRLGWGWGLIVQNDIF